MQTPLMRLEEKLFAEDDGGKFSRLKDRLLRMIDAENRDKALEILMRYVREGRLHHWRAFLLPDIIEVVAANESNYAAFFEWSLTQPHLAYWSVDGVLKTKGPAAYDALAAFACNDENAVETRAKAIKEMALAGKQRFDRELPEDPGDWEEKDLRLAEVREWQENGYALGTGYPSPVAHPSLARPGSKLERAAAKLAKKLEKLRKREKNDPAVPRNWLTVAAEEDMAAVAARWGLPDEYRIFLERYSPLNMDMETRNFPLGIVVYGASCLIAGQNGYSYNPVAQEPIEDWPEGYVVVGHTASDPFCIDVRGAKDADVLVYCARHGEGAWTFEVYAESFAAFLKKL